MDSSPSLTSTRKLQQIFLNPALYVPYFYLGEEFCAMASFTTTCSPSSTQFAASDFTPAAITNKPNKYTDMLSNGKKRTTIFCSTSQLSESSSNTGCLDSCSSNKRARMKRSMTSFIKLPSRSRESTTEYSFPFWNRFSSGKSLLSFSALSLTSSSKRRTQDSQQNLDCNLLNKKCKESNKNYGNKRSSKHKCHNFDTDLSRSQSCQTISNKSKLKKTLSANLTNNLKSSTNSAQSHCNVNSISRELVAEHRISDQELRTSELSLQYEPHNSMSDILECIPHMDSSSDDEDFRRRSLSTGVSRKRPVSSGSQLCALSNVSSDCSALYSNIDKENSKRGRPCSLMTDMKLCIESDATNEKDEDVTLEKDNCLTKHPDTCSDAGGRFKSETMKKLHLPRNSSASDVRASVRLRAKSIKKKAKALSLLIQKNPKHIDSEKANTSTDAERHLSLLEYQYETGDNSDRCSNDPKNRERLNENVVSSFSPKLHDNLTKSDKCSRKPGAHQSSDEIQQCTREKSFAAHVPAVTSIGRNHNRVGSRYINVPFESSMDHAMHENVSELEKGGGGVPSQGISIGAGASDLFVLKEETVHTYSPHKEVDPLGDLRASPHLEESLHASRYGELLAYFMYTITNTCTCYLNLKMFYSLVKFEDEISNFGSHEQRGLEYE